MKRLILISILAILIIASTYVVVAVKSQANKTPAAKPTVVGNLAKYNHPLGLFSLSYPESWQILREIEDEIVKYTVTPQTDKTKIDELIVYSQLSIVSFGEENILKGISAQQALEKLLPVIRQAEPEMLPQGEVKTGKLGNLPAALLDFQGGLKDKTGVFSGQLYVASDSEQEFFIVLVNIAPQEQFVDLRNDFAEIAGQFAFWPTKVSGRREKAFTVSELVERYKGAVVSICAFRDDELIGAGSGFVLREDGYVITNQHVIWDSEKNCPATRFTVEWDDKLSLSKQEAELIGYRRKESPLLLVNWGIDIALLKVSGDGPYTSVPLTPLAEVKLGDEIVTMGFPARGEALQALETLSLVITSGIVTRFNTDLLGEVESYYIDAPIAHGSSGGPCVSLATGGVIGLNTYGIDINVARVIKGSENLLNYHGVTLSDFISDEFPLAVKLTPAAETELDSIDYYDIALYCIHRQAYQAALRMAEKALEKDPDSSASYYLIGVLQIITAANQEELNAGIKSLTKALQLDPKNLPAMIHLAEVYIALGESTKAAEYIEKALAAEPKDWRPYETRAKMYLQQQKYDEAQNALSLAREYSYNIVPDPCLLAGEIYYKERQFEQGKQSYQAALVSQPANLPARLGVAEYSLLTKNYLKALLEYNNILKDFPNSPTAMAAVANCYRLLNKPEESWRYYKEAIKKWYKLTGSLPPKDVYLLAADVVLNKLNNIELAVEIYLQYLLFYFETFEASLVNKVMAQILSRNNITNGIVRAHLICSYLINNQDEELKGLLQQLSSALLAREDINWMLNFGYPELVVGRIVSVTPLDFKVYSDDDIRELLQEFPENVVNGILLSNELYKEQQQPAAGQEPAVQAPIASTAAAAPQALIGYWVSDILVTADGRQVQIEYSMDANGKYFTACRGLGVYDKGTYQIAEQYITFSSDDGTTINLRYGFVSGKLFIEVPNYGYVSFSKRG